MIDHLGLNGWPLDHGPTNVTAMVKIPHFFSTFFLSQAFKGLKNLKKITLDHNKIHTIQPFAFKVKPYLFAVNTFLHLNPTQGISNIEEISLRWNPIQTISGFAFAGMRNVSQIYLGYNK